MTQQAMQASRSGSLRAPTANVAVVIPIPNDPDWSIFEELAEEVPIIVVDDSDGKLAPAPRGNVRFFDHAAQRDVMGKHYHAIPHKSAATRNFGHYLAYREGCDVILALDYDCRPRPGWLEQHLSSLGPTDGVPALAGAWINSVEQPGFYARGYPYEYRNPEAAAVAESVASGEVKVNMGVWDNVLDLNGIDKLERTPPAEPGLRGPANYAALGNLPLCGMNVAFTADVTPAYFFLPDVSVHGWPLSRHDDIWGGYILKRIMDLRGDLITFGRPVVEHTRQSRMERVLVIEHYMHLMSMQFYAIVETSLDRVAPGSYAEMFGWFAQEYRREVEAVPGLPLHYREAFRELGIWMERWSACFA
ncbi:MAG: hypothetical protein ACRDJ4_04605 [Actinomycetota bacterium]